MRRSSVFALVALVFLLVVLLGSWVYLENYSWPFGGDSDESFRTADRDGGNTLCGEDPFADLPDPDADSGEGDGSAGGPLESTPESETKRAIPPEAVGTGGGTATAGEAEGSKPDEIVAERHIAEASIRASTTGEVDGLDPFIVSTLLAPQTRSRWNDLGWFDEAALKRNAPYGIVAGSKIAETSTSAVPGLDYVLIGQLVWPGLTAEESDELVEDNRRQAVVYLKRLPETRAVVYGDDGWFAIPATKRIADDFSKGLELVVHSPAFQIAGGKESVTLKKGDGAIRIDLELTPVFELVVDVTPQDAVDSGVRVWVERQGGPDGPSADDSLYMSAKVPPSGRLHFMIPEHYGELTVGATGESHHCGLAHRAIGWGWKKSKLKLNVRLEMVAEPCDRVQGQVVSDDGNPLKGARLQSTHFGTVAYSGPDGNFDMWVPFERGQVPRQFIVTCYRYRPEVVPLETGGVATPGVVRDEFAGTWKVSLAWKVTVEIEIPRAVSKLEGFYVLGHKEVLRENVKGGRFSLELPWDTRWLLYHAGKYDWLECSVITPKVWSEVFKLYANGKNEVARLELNTLEEAYERR